MRKIIFLFLVLASVHGHSQTGRLVNASCSPTNFNFIDATYNFSICIPKHYAMTHTKDGYVFTDTADKSKVLYISWFTNDKFSTAVDWTGFWHGVFTKGNNPPAVSSKDFILDRTPGQKITVKYKDGGEATLLIAPLNKSYSKILAIMAVEFPNSKEVGNIIYSAEWLLMQYSFKWL